MENTREAFDASLRMGFRALELDLVRLRDDRIVVYHDDTLERFFKDRRSPAELSLDEFRAIFPDLLTFDEFRSLYAERPLTINLEIKDDPRTLETILPDLHRFHDPVISSFQRSVVDRALELGLEAGFLFDDPATLLRQLPGLPRKRIHIPWTFLTEGLVEKPALHGFEIYCYTVNEEPILRKLQSIQGVRGVFTDNSDFARFVEA